MGCIYMGRAFMIKYGNCLVWYIWEESGLILGRVGGYIEGFEFFLSAYYIAWHTYHISNDVQKHQN